MAEDSVPEDVVQFLLKNIDSIAQWEGLLLLRTRSEKAWNAAEVAQDLYISEPDAACLLASLEARAMIKIEPALPPPLYRYQPRDADADALITRAATLYRRSVIPITNLIHSKHKTRVRQFADAFRLRKKE